VYAKCPLEGSGRPLNEIFIGCRKNGTVVLLQCSKLSHPVRDIGCEDRITWIHEVLGRESEVRADSWRHVVQSIIVGDAAAALAVSKGLGSALAHWHFAYQDIS